MKCIYCYWDWTFNQEHIIPKFLWSFEPINPKLTNVVCKNCNSNIFSGLENIFKEDSAEGIRSQMLNISNSNSVRIRWDNVKMECLTGSQDAFFNEIFPFLNDNEIDWKFVVDFQPQIKIRNYYWETGYQVFLIEALKRIKSKPKEFSKVKARISKTKWSDIAIFIRTDNKENQEELREAIQILNEYWVKYNEKKKTYSKFKALGPDINVHMECQISTDICRVIAKIAFNYFAYCCIQENQENILYESEFEKIKGFILNHNNTNKEEIVPLRSTDPITWHEKVSGRRFNSYIIVFYQENGIICAKITFLGWFVYTVILGKAKKDFLVNNFGCGHVFDPFSRSIHNLTGTPRNNPTKEEIKTSFGLYKRH